MTAAPASNGESHIVHGSVVTDKKRCSSIFANLLKMHDTATDGSTFIREFMQTKRCDKFHPEMKDRRESYRSYVNESAIAANVTGTWDRVMSFKEDETDQRIANQCVVHYLDYDRDKIVSGVSWGRWTRYYTIDQAERTLAAVGLFATGLGVVKSGRGLWSRVRPKPRPADPPATAAPKPPATGAPSAK